MGCERWREELSAQLDGEEDPAARAGLDRHLAGCPGCRQWLDRAAEVNRLARTRSVTPVPDLSAAVLAALPAGSPPGAGPAGGEPALPRRSVRPVAALFAALGLVGAVQLILGLAQVGRGASIRHAHTGADLAASAGHLWHESAAWNVAVGAGFLFIALRRSRPTGLVPMLSAFVGMLLLLSVNDLTAGRVEVARLVSHGFVIAGYLIVIALSRIAPGHSRPPGEERGAGWRLSDDSAASAPAVPALRLVPRGRPGPATARLTRPARRPQASPGGPPERVRRAA